MLVDLPQLPGMLAVPRDRCASQHVAEGSQLLQRQGDTHYDAPWPTDIWHSSDLDHQIWDDCSFSEAAVCVGPSTA